MNMQEERNDAPVVLDENEIENLKTLLLAMARALVNDPDAVNVAATDQGETLLMEVSCDADDVGRVIGRKGRRAQAMRTIMKARGNKLGVRIVVDFLG